MALVSRGRAAIALLAGLLAAACARTDLCLDGPCGGVEPVYTNAPGWLDYVRNDGGGGEMWNRCAGVCPELPPYDGVLCTGDEEGYYACVHAGELRFMRVPGLTSCAGATAHDDLGAFDWRCVDRGRRVLFISKRLKRGKGLRDLIGPDLQFLPNRVTVSKSGGAVFRTRSSRWWNNTMAALPRDNSEAVTLDADTLYVANEDVVSNGYSIAGSDRVGIVTLGDAEIRLWNGDFRDWCAPDGTVSSGRSTLLCMGGTASAPARFAWIEARLNGFDPTTGSDTGHLIYVGEQVRMARIHRSEVRGGARAGANDQAAIRMLYASSRSILVDSVSAHSNAPGLGETQIEVDGPAFVTIRDSRATGARDDGDGFTFASPHGLIAQSVAFGNSYTGLEVGVAGGPQAVVGFTAAANGGPGMALEGSGRGDTVLLATAALNNSGGGINDGVRIWTAGNVVANHLLAGTPVLGCLSVAGSSNTLRDIASVYNSCGIHSDGDNIFSGTLRIGNNGGNGGCVSNGSGGNLPTSSDCQPAAGYTPIIDWNPEGSFVGLVTADARNGTQSGAFPVASDAVSDWIHFENPYRGWGLAGGATLFDAASSGTCEPGSCRLYDYTLAATDSVARNQYGTWTNDGVCPRTVDPAVSAEAVLTDTAGRTFLAYAWELLEQWENPDGDFDGLCESNEACVFTPNVGSFQGLGDPTTTVPCTLAGGNGVTRVTLYAFPDTLPP